mgnify:CR=1 FL=1
MSRIALERAKLMLDVGNGNGNENNEDLNVSILQTGGMENMNLKTPGNTPGIGAKKELAVDVEEEEEEQEQTQRQSLNLNEKFEEIAKVEVEEEVLDVAQLITIVGASEGEADKKAALETLKKFVEEKSINIEEEVNKLNLSRHFGEFILAAFNKKEVELEKEIEVEMKENAAPPAAQTNVTSRLTMLKKKLAERGQKKGEGSSSGSGNGGGNGNGNGSGSGSGGESSSSGASALRQRLERIKNRQKLAGNTAK